jgi:dTDP-4-dehydrorhamnose 3,5-epimerase
MKVTATSLPDVFVLESPIFRDDRGFFLESYHREKMAKLGIGESFVQDNLSYSKKNVVRGLHYQIPHPQGKLIRVVGGEIFDVVVDLRRTSSTFGRWFGVLLSEDNCRMLWIPSGFAHGFSVISDGAHVLYKTTDWYHPESERTIRWNDSDLNIDWRLSGQPIISAKDGLGVPFAEANKFE